MKSHFSVLPVLNGTHKSETQTQKNPSHFQTVKVVEHPMNRQQTPSTLPSPPPFCCLFFQHACLSSASLTSLGSNKWRQMHLIQCTPAILSGSQLCRTSRLNTTTIQALLILSRIKTPGDISSLTPKECASKTTASNVIPKPVLCDL